MQTFWKILRATVLGASALSGASLVVMMTLTCLDVMLRLAGNPLKGTYDIVGICAALTVAGALPRTTAAKGHVAIEFFFHKLNRPGRIVVDSITRVLGIFLFTALAWHSCAYGFQIRRIGQVSQTLQWPIFWVPWAIALSCLLTALVILRHLLVPRREMIRP